MKKYLPILIRFLFEVKPKQKDTAPQTREQIITEAKNLYSYLKEFHMSDFSNHSIEENEKSALPFFKKQYKLFQSLLSQHHIDPSELGVKEVDMNEFAQIAIN